MSKAPNVQYILSNPLSVFAFILSAKSNVQNIQEAGVCPKRCCSLRIQVPLKLFKLNMIFASANGRKEQELGKSPE